MSFHKAFGLSDENLPRCGRLAQWLRHLDVDFYRTHADLAHMGREALVAHFVKDGWTEGRVYNRVLYSFIDPKFYLAHYPELGLADEDSAVVHWMYEGYFAGLIPNAGTKRVLDSDIHLYQLGKVGSKAIEAAIYDAGYDRLVLHFHWPSDFLRAYPDCFLGYEEVMARNVDKPIRIISGVRDPFERLISGFYQSSASHDAPSLDAAMKTIRALVASPQRNLVLDWFAHDFYRGLDVYNLTFDANAGFGTYEKGNLRLFLYRHDVLPHVVGELSRFVDLDLKLGAVNRTSDKEHAGSFGTLMQTARFPKSLVDEVLGSTYVRHFFTEAQIDGMAKRWTE